jgi:serine/threonine protein kinase
MLQAQQRLGDFEIIRLLGRGGMGEVYEAQQFAPRRRVALKVLAPWLCQDEEALRRFWREAEVPAQLDHPNIVRIIATGKTEDGTAFYTMQLVRGIALGEMIRRARDVPQPTVAYTNPSAETPSVAAPAAVEPHDPAVPEVKETPALCRDYVQDRYRALARIGAAVARALAFAHRQGYLHRDLKPSNIMVDHHDQVYVVDFGLTRALAADANGSRTGFLTGTPSYMSPEQADTKPVDGRSDIYSLGVTLYELATHGIGPYTASRLDAEGVLAQVRTGQCLPLHTLQPDVPPTLEHIIGKAMAFRPDERYADAADLATDLERFLEGRLPSSPVHRKSSPSKSARPVAWLVRVAATVLLVLGLILLWNRFGAGVGIEPESNSPPAAPNPDAQPGPQAKNPLPPMLLQRPWRVPINLFTKHPVEPIWSKTLEEPGTHFPFPEHLHLAAAKLGTRFLLALDDDPQERDFEFSIEMMPILSPDPSKNQLGAFIGWHPPLPADPTQIRSYLAINLNKQNGFFEAVCIDEIKAMKPGQGSVGGTKSLPAGKGILPLAAAGPWHALKIQVVANRVTITVDGKNSTELDLVQIKPLNPVFAHLNPRGALGIWTNGDAMFRNAQVMALPSAPAGK